jgi:hypothetical protein
VWNSRKGILSVGLVVENGSVQVEVEEHLSGRKQMCNRIQVGWETVIEDVTEDW